MYSASEIVYQQEAKGHEHIRKAWLGNEVWEANLRVVDSLREGHSVRIIWQDQATGNRYHMLLSDVFKLLNQATIIDGVVCGRWKANKRGQSYGISYYGKRKDK